LLQGYLRVTDDAYASLKLTAKSELVLKGLEKVELISSQTTDEKETAPLDFEAELLNTLRKKRQEIAVMENLPAYIILSDATLLEIATYLPQKLEELRLISGFGDIKLARYGREFLALVTQYCAQKGLESRIGQKTPKRERKPKKEQIPETARASLALFKQGLSAADIARLRSLSPNTIENHLGVFVQSGELDVLTFVKEEKIPAIKDAVEKYGNERLAPLKEVLGEDYSYGEIRAVIAWLNRQNQLT
jgi:ATP-dependent DNA helicase RecQ